MPASDPKVPFFSRIVAFLLSLIVWIYIAFVTVAIYIPMAFCTVGLYFFDRNRRVNAWWGRLWGRSVISWNPFWRVEVLGRENIQKGQAYVMISNHQSLADILVLSKINFHYKWMSKDEIFKVPFLGSMVFWAGHVRLKRGGLRSIRQAIARAEFWLGRGISMMMFPEGTRSNTGELAKFLDGAFLLAIKTQRPILPIVLTGTRDAMPKGSFVFRTKQVGRIQVLPPIDVSGFTLRDIEQLKSQVHQVMLKAKLVLEASMSQPLSASV